MLIDLDLDCIAVSHNLSNYTEFPPSKPSSKMENISFVMNTNGICLLSSLS